WGFTVLMVRSTVVGFPAPLVAVASIVYLVLKSNVDAFEVHVLRSGLYEPFSRPLGPCTATSASVPSSATTTIGWFTGALRSTPGRVCIAAADCSGGWLRAMSVGPQPLISSAEAAAPATAMFRLAFLIKPHYDPASIVAHADRSGRTTRRHFQCAT